MKFCFLLILSPLVLHASSYIYIWINIFSCRRFKRKQGDGKEKIQISWDIDFLALIFFFSFFLDCIIYIRIYVIDNALCTHVLFFLTITLTSRVIYCFFSAFFRDTYLFLYLILQTVIVYAVFFFLFFSLHCFFPCACSLFPVSFFPSPHSFISPS